MNYFSQILASIILMLSLTLISFAQSTGNYAYSTSTSGSLVLDKDGNSIDMSTGTTDLYGPNVDTYIATVQTLSFTFVFMGVPYTQFSVSPDGGVRFGSTPISLHTYSPTTNTAFISLTNIDNKTGVGTGKVHYKVQSGTGGQVLIIEWKDILINWNASGTTLSTFQLRLYQATGQIEMVYGKMWNSSTSAQNGVIWFGSSNTANTVGQINSITTTPTYNSTATFLTTTSFTASSAMTNLHSTSDGSRRVFTFTPPAAPANPTALNFPTVGAYGMVLNWTDNATTETGYLVYRSLDGTNYNLVGTLPANSTSYTAIGLTPSTLYYWQVYAINEGRLSNALSASQATSSSPSLSGTRTIGNLGAGADYATLTAAVVDIQLQGLAGALVLEFLSSYAGGETFPITLTSLTTTSSNTLTIRPASGVSGITITGTHATNLIRIENEDYVIIDGRPGGTGTSRELTFSNTSIDGTTFTFINEASNNTIRFCVIRGVNTNTSSGVILFSTTTGSNGNDNNLIEYCDIRDGATTPTNLIYSAGTTTTTSQFNSGNTIANCNIFNFYNSGTTNAGVGINLQSGSSDWTITGNSFYQTTSRTTFGSGATQNAILVESSANNGIVITNNFIGGTEPNCGGSAYTLNTTSTLVFRAIQMIVGTTTPSSLQGNTIKNISVTTASASTAQSMLSLVTGSFNVGNVTGNTIGDHGTGGAITFSSSGTTALFAPILTGTGTPGTIVIQNNNIANITVSGTGTVQVRGISAQGAGTYTINNNTIGGTVANSIVNNTNHTTYGIHITSTSATVTCNGNTLQNITANNTGAAGQLLGIFSQAATSTINNNTIRVLSTNNTNTTGAQLIGIIVLNTSSSSNTISQNTIHTLKQTNSGSGTIHNSYGIYYSAGTSGTSIISRNFIHSLSLATTGSSINTQIRGIEIFSGAVTVVNNMVRVGIDEDGNSITGNYFIQGINKSSSENVNIYHNSVFVGGSGVGSGSQPTHAFRRVNTGIDDVRNNIFVNARSNGTGTGKHYGITLNNATTITSNYNLFHVTGTGGVFGSADGGTTDRATLSAWQTATGFDGNSAHGSPNFVNATGSASEVDLHVTNPTPVESHGVLISSVTDDFDAETRSGLTPVDIGADAGNFTVNDIFPPVITYTALLNTLSNENRTLASVTITDVTGVPTSGTLQPRIWFRRSAPTATVWGSTQGSLSSGSGTNGVWTFTIDYSVIDVTPVAGETYQYYIVAQDEVPTPNITTNPSGGVHTSVNTQTSAPLTPNSYNILIGFSGTYNVGSGQTYTSLTGAGGLFAAINGSALTGNVTVLITSDLTETASNALNQWTEEPSGSGYTLTIAPNNGTVKTISGSVAGGLIRLNGADRVTIDGRFGGSGNYLTFSNTSTSSSGVFQIISLGAGAGAVNNTIRNCNISTGTSSATTYGISIGGSTLGTSGADNDNISILDNVITVASVGIYAYGIDSTSSGGLDNLTISGNSVTCSTSVPALGIRVGNALNSLISQNTLDIRQSVGNAPVGISIETGVNNTTVTRNLITRSAYTGTGGFGGRGITVGTGLASSNITLSNNVIYGVTGDNFSSFSNSSSMGIAIGVVGNSATLTTTTGGVNLYFNSVNMYGNYNRATACVTTALYVGSFASALDIRNNIFTNTMDNLGTASKSYAIYSAADASAFTKINYNTYFAPVPEGVLGYLTSDRADLASWKTATGQDAYSISGNPAFTSNTNLIPNNSNVNSWNVANKGVHISSVNVDFTGATRPTTPADGTPDIGAYEFATPNIAPPAATQTGTLTAGGTTNYFQGGMPLGQIN